MKPWYLLLCILMLPLVVCLPVSAEANATPKAVVLDLSMNGDVVNLIGSHVVNNYPPDNRATKKIVIRMLDAKIFPIAPKLQPKKTGPKKTTNWQNGKNWTKKMTKRSGMQTNQKNRTK